MESNTAQQFAEKMFENTEQEALQLRAKLDEYESQLKAEQERGHTTIPDMGKYYTKVNDLMYESANMRIKGKCYMSAEKRQRARAKRKKK